MNNDCTTINNVSRKLEVSSTAFVFWENPTHVTDGQTDEVQGLMWDGHIIMLIARQAYRERQLVSKNIRLVVKVEYCWMDMPANLNTQQ